MKSQEISNALELPNIELPTAVVLSQTDSQLDSDFEYARGNIINILEKGNEALDGILDVAGMSQHPRSYEVVATLIKTMADVNKDLLELTKKRKEISGEANNPSTINNNLFVGSTAELQKLLKNNGDK